VYVDVIQLMIDFQLNALIDVQFDLYIL